MREYRLTVINILLTCIVRTYLLRLSISTYQHRGNRHAYSYQYTTNWHPVWINMLFILLIIMYITYRHRLSLIAEGSWPNITAPFNTAIPAPSGIITFLSLNLQTEYNCIYGAFSITGTWCTGKSFRFCWWGRQLLSQKLSPLPTKVETLNANKSFSEKKSTLKWKHLLLRWGRGQCLLILSFQSSPYFGNNSRHSFQDFSWGCVIYSVLATPLEMGYTW